MTPNFKKIILPSIRNISANIIARDLTGVQALYGIYCCVSCKAKAFYTTSSSKGDICFCPYCFDVDSHPLVALFNKKQPLRFDNLYDTENIIETVKPKIMNIDIAYITTRPFMHGDIAPNEYYYNWLVENIGIQGEDWEWEMMPDDYTRIKLYFSKLEHGTFFELKWD